MSKRTIITTITDSALIKRRCRSVLVTLYPPRKPITYGCSAQLPTSLSRLRLRCATSFFMVLERNPIGNYLSKGMATILTSSGAESVPLPFMSTRAHKPKSHSTTRDSVVNAWHDTIKRIYGRAHGHKILCCKRYDTQPAARMFLSFKTKTCNNAGV